MQNKTTQDLHDSAAKLEAVISNYSGIIWSVDQNNVITLLNGLYIKSLGLTPESFEGWKLEDAQAKNPKLKIIANVQKTIDEGPQDWITEINGRKFHAHTTPILDDNLQVTHVVGSIDDVTEMARLQEKLELALKKAQAADHAKSDFLAKMSHEMRTPLNAIIGLSDLILDAENFGEEERSNIEKVYNAGATLLSTVNDILDISKIAADKLELVPIEYDVPSLLNDTITQSIMHAGEKPIQFELDIDETLPMCLCGDELRIKQLFNNLLSNAFKYTKAGTVKMGLSCVKNGETVLVTVYVQDTGIGIKPENIHTIFEDYGRVDAKTNHMIMGTGLGLPITKKLVELMGGSITVESEYGKGSVFTAKFPQKFVNDTVIGSETAHNLKTFHYTDSKRHRSSSLGKIKLPYARVLVVDDVETNLDVSRGLMRPYGMQIDCMKSGQEAIDAVRAEKVKYNAIFMDHMMPEMDGIEATQLIRQINTEYAKTVPIIALTANAIVGNAEMFLSNGFQAFLSKPIEIARLDAVIKDWVRDKEKEKQYLAEHAGEQVPPALTREESDEANKIKQWLLASNIPGVDIKKGLTIFGDNASAYIDILRSYVKNIPQLLEAAKNVNKENLENYRVTVHGIKGASRSVCASAVADQAEALEKAAKDGNIDFIVGNSESFQKATAKLISDINNILAQINSDKPKKAKPDNAVLLQLLKACKKYDTDEVDAATDELEKYAYESDAELVNWLLDNVQLMNFKEIVEKLSAIPGLE